MDLTKAVFKVKLSARVSTKDQAREEKISLPEQVEWAENFCKERGWEYLGYYTDSTEGDVEFDKRPGGFQLLEDAKLGIFNLVLFYHSSRLAREPWVGLKTISILGKQGIQTYIKNAPIEPVPPDKYIYGSNVAAEYLTALSLVGDKQENIARGERVTFGHKNIAQKGTLVFAPYGFKKLPKIEFTSDGRQIYSWSYELDPYESIIVQRIFNEYRNGKSLRKIMQSLIKDTVPSPSGKTGLGSWSAATIKNILSNPAYIGKVRWGRKLGSKYRQGRRESGKQKRVYTSADKWILSESTNSPKIIDDTLFTEVQERLKLRGKVSGRQLSSDSLLTGLVYCGDCQRRAYSKTRWVKKDGKRYIRTDYIDQSYFRGLDCRRHLISAAKLDQLVLMQLQTRFEQLTRFDIEKQLENKDLETKKLMNDSITQIERQLKTFESKKSRLLEIYLNGSLTKEEYSVQKERLDSEQTLLTQEKLRIVSVVEDSTTKIESLKTLKKLLEMFTKLDDNKLKKEMLQRIIETVVIYKDRVEVVYKYSSSSSDSYVNVKPHPCGYLGDKSRNCICNHFQIQRYQKRVSGPMLDRIDIHIDVPVVKADKLTADDKTYKNEPSKAIRERVQKARNIQMKRYAKTKILSNSDLNNKTIKEYCKLSDDCRELLKQAVVKLNLSGRSYHRIIKLGRTIADLQGVEEITVNHLAEALQYRPRTQEV